MTFFCGFWGIEVLNFKNLSVLLVKKAVSDSKEEKNILISTKLSHLTQIF